MKTEMSAVEITKKVATHEAGHGALYAILFQDLRNFRLTLANRDNQNIAQLEFDTNFPCTEQKEAVNSIAICLGGKSRK